jgi:hypothetical protein
MMGGISMKTNGVSVVVDDDAVMSSILNLLTRNRL